MIETRNPLNDQRTKMKTKVKSGVSAVACVALCGIVNSASAEPGEVSQGDKIGAGQTFRRGSSCTVVTVLHTVPYDGVEVRVTDRTGGSTTGQRIFDSADFDLALVSLPENAAVACSESWPETGWISSANFTYESIFEIVRHTSHKETIVPVRYVGGTPNTVTLRPEDKGDVWQGFSGSVVREDRGLLAIVKNFDTATGKIEALRFDWIDRLVGDRFRSRTRGGSPVYFEGVFQRDRVKSTWTTYVNAWLRDESGRQVFPAQSATTGCGIRVNVLDWAKKRLPNPDYESLQQQYDSCGTLNVLGQFVVLKAGPEARRACQKKVRAKMNEVGRYLQGHHITIEAIMTPSDGPIESKLETVDIVLPPAAVTSRTEEEMRVMQKSAGTMLTSLFETGVCD
jgi:hypothetical protein